MEDGREWLDLRQRQSLLPTAYSNLLPTPALVSQIQMILQLSAPLTHAPTADPPAYGETPNATPSMETKSNDGYAETADTASQIQTTSKKAGATKKKWPEVD